MSQTTTDVAAPEVLTLSEAAEYLRVSESDIIDSATQRELPGRKIGDQWRFHKQALVNWLCIPENRDFWKTQFGALKDDPHRDEMLASIYEQRGRPMIEED